MRLILVEKLKEAMIFFWKKTVFKAFFKKSVFSSGIL